MEALRTYINTLLPQNFSGAKVIIIDKIGTINAK